MTDSHFIWRFISAHLFRLPGYSDGPVAYFYHNARRLSTTECIISSTSLAVWTSFCLAARDMRLCCWSYTSCEMTAYRLVIINESTRHHVHLVHKFTQYRTVHLHRTTLRCVCCWILPMKHTDPLNISQYCYYSKDRDLKETGCQWQTSHLCISHLFRPEHPDFFSSELNTFNTFISFVQANILMDMFAIIEKQCMGLRHFVHICVVGVK
jgi:hypothetical protein